MRIDSPPAGFEAFEGAEIEERFILSWRSYDG